MLAIKWSGTPRTRGGDNYAFLWQSGSGMQDLGTLGGSQQQPPREETPAGRLLVRLKLPMVQSTLSFTLTGK